MDTNEKISIIILSQMANSLLIYGNINSV